MPFADNLDAQIFFIARLPRVVAAALVGASLAAAGVVFQALLRNPLATPDTLGVSSGAALGAMLAITFHLDFTFAGLPSIPLASLAGSLFALAVVYALATGRRRGLSTTVLLLAGVTMTGVPLGADDVHAVPGQLHRHVPYRAVADGDARRRELRADPDRPADARGRRSRCSRRCHARSI